MFLLLSLSSNIFVSMDDRHLYLEALPNLEALAKAFYLALEGSPPPCASVSTLCLSCLGVALPCVETFYWPAIAGKVSTVDKESVLVLGMILDFCTLRKYKEWLDLASNIWNYFLTW